MNELPLGLTVFIAGGVEWVEALTVTLAMGVTRGWRTALIAAGSALITLAAIVAIFGRAFPPFQPDETIPWLGRLWLIAGALLLIVGLQWTRKAILRLSSVLPSRDEAKVYHRLLDASADAAPSKPTKIDWYSFAVVYKAVLLEGFEVVFIVIAFGYAQGSIGVGIVAALAALVVVALLGLAVHRPLTRVPENAMKLTVGIMLTTFGTYFAAMGAGVRWPHGEVAILGILAFNLLLVGLLLAQAKRLSREKRPAKGSTHALS